MKLYTVKLYSVLLVSLIVGFNQVGQAQPLRIGVITSLTGPAGEQGRNWLSGAELAQKELAAKGEQIELLIEDDGTNPSQAATAFQRMARNSEVQAVIGGTWDFVAEPLYPLALQHKIPFVAPTNPFEMVSNKQKENPYIFVTGLSVRAMAEAFSKFLVEKKVKTLALVYPQLPFGELQADAFKQMAARHGVSIVSDQPFPPADYHGILKLSAVKIRNSNPDLVYIVTNYSGLDLFTKELTGIGVSPLILTSQHLGHAFEFSNDPPRYKKCYGIYPASVLSTAFKEKFVASYKHEPRVYAAEGYDAVGFLSALLKTFPDFATNKREFSFTGISGEFKLPARTHSRAPVYTPAIIMTTKNGVFEPEA